MNKKIYLGVFLVSLATIFYELLLSRVWSVTMWYHFAFVAISITMFGMTVGAILVYLLPKYFTAENVYQRLSESSLLFGVSTVVTFFVQLAIPFSSGAANVHIFNAALIYLLVAIPFVFSGIAITLALSKFPAKVSQLYAADLCGAAFGCMLIVAILRIMDGPTAVIFASAAATSGAWCFASGKKLPRLTKASLGCALLLTIFTCVNTYLISQQHSLTRLTYVKGKIETPPLFEKWNCQSRVTVSGDPDKAIPPIAWGLATTCKQGAKLPQLWLSMDGTLQTVLTRFNGDFKQVDYLKCDVTNLAYHLKPQGEIAIIGAGAGRDILSALTFGVKSITAIEINDLIISTLNNAFGDFSGHLDRYPQVQFVHNEARSYLAGLDRKFDLIQLAIIDTQVASAAGAYGLTENSLYTVEAWKIFLSHLRENGILTCTRWCFTALPGETYRLAALARQSLNELGVKDTKNHIMVVRHKLPNDSQWSTATMLVSRSPFTAADISKFEKITSDFQFELIQSPKVGVDPTLDQIATGNDLKTLEANFPIRIDAPTDDNPFFFYMVKTKDLFNTPLEKLGVPKTHTAAEKLLAPLLIAVTVLSVLAFLVPLDLGGKTEEIKRSAPFFLFFTCIGLGFMLIEVSQMERFIIFLGNPTYSLSVVLFTLLISSALGSLLSQKLISTDARAPLGLSILVVLLCVFGAATPLAVARLESAAVLVRVATAGTILFAPGFFMGMAFPTGIKLAAKVCPHLTPWLWAINGAASVCASVLAIFIAVNASISCSFWSGTVCYVVSLLAVLRMCQATKAHSLPLHSNDTPSIGSALEIS